MAPAHRSGSSHRTSASARSLPDSFIRARPVLAPRLGEGTDATLSVPVPRSRCAISREMATFAKAAVSNRACAG
ncbi:MAG: nicotinate-nucleotide--dimethylbenzimidazole phosphoribosyltransferase [Gemmatimonadales bacterium]